MAHKLADELLSMILAPSLSISDSQFTSSSRRSFGRNDHFPSSDILLVCKKWMRIATPLLYETIILRSIGQSHSLVDAFKTNADFGQHVRKIRLEGAYSRLFEVFKHCTNLHSLFFILWDIMSADNVNALCRSLPVINPTRVIFLDEDSTDYQGDNANKRMIFSALCSCIPTWTKLREFHYPYAQDLFSSIPSFEKSTTRRNRLAIALRNSPSLELVVHAETPRMWDYAWARLASNDRICFHFDMEPPAGRGYDDFLDTLSTTPDLKRAVTFKSHLPLPISRGLSCSATLASADPGITETTWIQIFEFALLPDDTELSDAIQDLASLSLMIRTRNAISLVCNDWHRMLERFFLSAPLLTSSAALVSFTGRILENPALGSQVLTFSLLTMLDIPNNFEEILCTLLPYLTRLRHFIGIEVELPYEAFEILTRTAGKSLTTVLNLEIRDVDVVSPCILDRLESVKKLQLQSFPSLPRGHDSLCLETVESLSFGDMSPYSTFFASLLLPRLVKVAFSRATIHEQEFLDSLGSRIIDMEVAIFEPNSDVEDCEVELLGLCPNLCTLRIGSLFEFHCPKFLESSNGNDVLKNILISGKLVYPGDKVVNMELERLFAALPFERLPNLRNVQFVEYEWPCLHRDIARDYLIKKAVSLNEQYGLSVTDKTGKPFRPRVQVQKRSKRTKR